VVLTVSAPCTGEPLTSTEVDEQTGAGLALVTTLQLKVTVPTKPPDGVMIVVKAAEPPAVTVILAGLGEDSEKPALVGLTVNVTGA
jgi:hypothetical protein